MQQLLAKNHKHPQLTQLPCIPEIRDHIYKYVLCSNSPVRVGDDILGTRIDGKPCHKSHLSILLLSRQTYIEAFHIFYRFNNFYFTSSNVSYRFLRNIGYVRRQHITAIEFHWSGSHSNLAFRLLKTCRGLKFLKTPIMHNEPDGYMALREVRGLEKVMIDELPAHDNYHFNPSIYNDPRELERAMMRPRLKYYAANPDEKLDLFKRRRKSSKMTEGENLALANKIHIAWTNRNYKAGDGISPHPYFASNFSKSLHCS